MGFNPLGEFWKGLYPLTDAEKAIEPAVASLGLPYRSQFPCFLFQGMGKWFPDFLLPTIGVVLEVDDDSHLDPEKQKADAQRTSALEKLGYVVVRCSNDEAESDPYGTVDRLIRKPGLLRRSHPGLPPAAFKTKHYRKKKKCSKSSSRS
jgi:very-short-patch-repair endonuclease